MLPVTISIDFYGNFDHGIGDYQGQMRQSALTVLTVSCFKSNSK